MQTQNPTTVLIFGTFDIFHKGHINFIKQARACGDSNSTSKSTALIAVIARDKTVLEIKGKLPKNNENKRKKILLKSGLVDKVVLGSLKDKYSAIRKYKPAIICLGYDQTNFVAKLPLLYKKGQGVVIRLKPYKPHIYKSSLMKSPATKT